MLPRPSSGAGQRSGGRRAPPPASNVPRFPPESNNPSDEAIIHEMISDCPRAGLISAYVERFKHSPNLRHLATTLYGAAGCPLSATSNLNTTGDRLALHAALNILRLKRALLEYPDLVSEFPNNEDLNRAVEAHRRKYGDKLSQVERGREFGLLGLSERDPNEVASIRRSLERLLSNQASEIEKSRFLTTCVDDEEILEAVKQELERKMHRSNNADRMRNATTVWTELAMKEFERDDVEVGHGVGAQSSNRQQPSQGAAAASQTHRPVTRDTVSGERREVGPTPAASIAPTPPRSQNTSSRPAQNPQTAGSGRGRGTGAGQRQGQEQGQGLSRETRQQMRGFLDRRNR